MNAVDQAIKNKLAAKQTTVVVPAPEVTNNVEVKVPDIVIPELSLETSIDLSPVVSALAKFNTEVDWVPLIRMLVQMNTSLVETQKKLDAVVEALGDIKTIASTPRVIEFDRNGLNASIRLEE